LRADSPAGCATAPGSGLIGTCGASRFARDVVPRPAQNSASALAPPAASPAVRHPENLSFVPGVRDWRGLGPDGAIRTSDLLLLAFGSPASNIAPARPTPVANTARSIPSPLLRLAARSTIR